MKIGIISFEHLHAYSYLEVLMNSGRAEVTAIFDEREDFLKGLKKNYPKINYYNDYKTLLKNSGVEAVCIASANTKHAVHAIAAAKAGKHILCEKPLADNLKDAEKIIEACKKSGVKLMTAFPVRFAPAVTRAKEIIKAGKLGEIAAVKTTNHGSMPGGWFIEKKLSGGGAIMDHTVHVADLLRYLFEAEFKNVYAESSDNLYKNKVEDCGLLLFEMTNGVIGSIDTSWSRPPAYKIWGDVTLEIKGTKGNLSIDCFPAVLNIYKNKTMKHTTVSGVDDYNAAMIDEFIDSIEQNREPAVSGEDGMKAVELAIAAYKSIKTRTRKGLDN